MDICKLERQLCINLLLLLQWLRGATKSNTLQNKNSLNAPLLGMLNLNWEIALYVIFVVIAVITRSLLSLTALSGNPTIPKKTTLPSKL